MRAEVDPESCIACGLCTELCPAVFEMDEDAGVACARDDEVPEDAEDCAQQAAEDCPVSAITVG